MRHIERTEASYVPLVETQELPARGEIVVYDIEYMTIYAGLQPSQYDRFRTVVNIAERQRIGSAEVKKDTKGIDTDTTAYGRSSRAIYITGSDNHVRDPIFAAVVRYDFVLLHLCKAVSVTAQVGTCLHWA
jgi:hypothetical protein